MHESGLSGEAVEQMRAWDHSGGFSLDASVCVGARDRASLERLLRYCARPPLAGGRLIWNHDSGDEPRAGPIPPVRYLLPKPDRDGRTVIELTPLELLDRLAVLISPEGSRDLEDSMLAMVDRKRALYADEDRVVHDFGLTFDGDQAHLSVISTPTERPASGLITFSAENPRSEQPELDWVEMSRGMGVEACRVADTGDLARALETGLASTGPYLIEIEL